MRTFWACNEPKRAPSACRERLAVWHAYKRVTQRALPHAVKQLRDGTHTQVGNTVKHAARVTGRWWSYPPKSSLCVFNTPVVMACTHSVMWLGLGGPHTALISNRMVPSWDMQVVNAVKHAARVTGKWWSYPPKSSLCMDSGAGNNWANGYHGYGPSVREPALDLIRREVGCHKLRENAWGAGPKLQRLQALWKRNALVLI
eukprot:811534-Pelagomonas_calceolata.AAC.4